MRVTKQSARFLKAYSIASVLSLAPKMSELSEESDDCDSVTLAELKAKVKELEQRSDAKSNGKAALTSLERRLQRKDRLPSHLCGDILSYRYGNGARFDLSKDVVSIRVFVNLARYLVKHQVESLATHGASMRKAIRLLADHDYHSSWFDHYMSWKKGNRKLALQFFLGTPLPMA